MIILVILENKEYRANVHNLLTSANYQVVITSSSEEAISLLKVNTVDLIITEVNIGHIDGWRLSRLIRTGILACSDSVPIILVTESYCEHIAESTARMFDINRVISFPELDTLPSIVPNVVSGKNNSNRTQNILVIEDTEDTANLVQRILKNKFNVDLAYNGISGIDAYKSKPYDIVLLDIMMPGLSGDEVLDIILSINPKQVVIVMTAHGTSELAEILLVKGATDYLQKPFKAEQLRDVCDIASKREDFLMANKQFNEKAVALTSEQSKYDSLSRKHYRVLDSLSSTVIELSTEGKISFLNNAWQSMTKFSIDESIGYDISDFIYENAQNTQQLLKQTIKKLSSGSLSKQAIEIQIKLKNGSFVWCEFNISPLMDVDRNIIGVSGTIEDISTRKKSEEQLKHIALHDTLTGMYNRYYFDIELGKFSNDAARSGNIHSLLYIDLDHFKIINDSQGHHQGDLVLQEVSRLLSECSRKNDILCRIGGDEFAILLSNTNTDDAKLVAKELCESLVNSSFTFNQQTYKISCSIGISSINGKASCSDTYLQHADIAMFAAKEKGRNRAHIYQEGDQVTAQLKDSFEWVQKLQHALSQNNVEMHFQPIIDTKTREVVCYEALVRLIVEDKLIYPDSFIPSLEKANDMNLLDRHVIDTTLQLMANNSLLHKVAINLSAQAFTDDRLYTYIADKFFEYQIEPSRVVFELTESASLSNITATQRMITHLAELGCHFSIDDFGTGFSTFAYLKQIPAGSVKIDGSFVKDMINQPTDAVLVKAINDTAHALNKKTVAEFVENQEILDKLEEIGVDYAQGYFIGKPIPLDKVKEQSKQSYSFV